MACLPVESNLEKYPEPNTTATALNINMAGHKLYNMNVNIYAEEVCDTEINNHANRTKFFNITANTLFPRNPTNRSNNTLDLTQILDSDSLYNIMESIKNATNCLELHNVTSHFNSLLYGCFFKYEPLVPVANSQICAGLFLA